MDGLRETVGTWTSLTDPAGAEMAAGAGFDFVVVDTEHAPLGLETVADCLRAIAARDADGVVRVPWNDAVRIKRLLDLGPDGLLVPMVETAEEAAEAVEASRYPPEGSRGVAAGRAADYGRNFESYVETDHRDLVVVVQVETETAVENAPAIAGVDGVDGLFVGPADLSASLDAFGEWTDPELREAMRAVIDSGDEGGVPVGTLGTTPDQVRALGSVGFDYMVAGADFTHLLEGQKRVLDAATDVL